jgi:hypothetical protein
MATNGTKAGPARAGGVESRPPPWLLGLTLKIWARHWTAGVQAALLRSLVFAEESRIAAETAPTAARAELYIEAGALRAKIILRAAFEREDAGI